MELELLLKLRDNMSRGMKTALDSINRDTKGLKGNLDSVARAADRIKPSGIQRMTKAILEMKKGAQGTLDVLQKAAQVSASAGAAGYVLKAAAQKPMDFDRQLALTANVAYSDRDATGRIAGKLQLEAAVRRAQAEGLGSQEELLQTLNEMVGSGAMGPIKSSINMLPTLAKAASGTGSNPGDLAKIAIAAKQNMGMTDEETKQFISKAITAGNLGGFELKDMARHLPEQMALYSANGMKGPRGAEDLLAYNQASRITAGNSDQAGNNLTNLLTKINGPDTQNDFKKRGIDLTASLANARGKGIGTLDAFLKLIEGAAGKDKEYIALREKAASQTGDEQKLTLNSMADILQQKGIGKFVQDRQAMAALLAAIQQAAKIKEVREGMAADTGGQIETNYKVVNSTASASAERTANLKDKAASDLMSDANGPLKKMLDAVNSAAEAHPVLTKAAYGAATALGAVAAFAGISGLLKAKNVPPVPPAATTAARTGLNASLGMRTASTAAAAAAGGGVMSKVPVIGLLMATLYSTYEFEKKSSKLREEGFAKAKARIEKEQSDKLKVTVEVKNGNVLASVNKENSRQAGRN